MLVVHVRCRQSEVRKLWVMLSCNVRRWHTNVCRLRKILVGHIFNRLTVVRWTKAMKADHVRRRLTIVCRTKAMQAGLAWRDLTIVCRQKATQAGNSPRRLNGLFKPRTMLEVHARKWLINVLPNASNPWPTFSERCAQTSGPWLMSHSQCLLLLVDTFFLMRRSLV